MVFDRVGYVCRYVIWAQLHFNTICLRDIPQLSGMALTVRSPSDRPSGDGRTLKYLAPRYPGSIAWSSNIFCHCSPPWSSKTSDGMD